MVQVLLRNSLLIFRFQHYFNIDFNQFKEFEYILNAVANGTMHKNELISLMMSSKQQMEHISTLPKHMQNGKFPLLHPSQSPVAGHMMPGNFNNFHQSSQMQFRNMQDMHQFGYNNNLSHHGYNLEKKCHINPKQQHQHHSK